MNALSALKEACETIGSMADAMDIHLDGSPGDFAVARHAIEEHATALNTVATAVPALIARVEAHEVALAQLAAAFLDQAASARDEGEVSAAILAPAYANVAAMIQAHLSAYGGEP